MMVSARIPVVFSARLRAGGPLRLVGCCEQIELETPEVADADAPVVFRGVAGGTPFSRGPVAAYGHGVALRHYEDRLYERMPDGAVVDGVVGNPFPVVRDDVRSRRAAAALRRGPGYAPLSELFQAIRWRNNSRWVVNRSEVPSNPIYNIWPSGPPNPEPRFAHLNAVNLADLSRRVVDADEFEMERCVSDAAAHARFIAVDGGLWRAVATPVYKVTNSFDHGLANLLRAPVPIISICEKPLHCDADLTTRYFPLTDPQSVKDHCDAMLDNFLKKLGKPGHRRALAATADETFRFECSACDTLAFDHEADLLRRVSHGFALEAHAFLAKNGDYWRERVGDAAFDSAARAHAELVKSDWLAQDFGDPSPWLTDNIRTWKLTGRHCSTVFHYGERDEANRLLAKIDGLADQLPISIAAMGFSTAAFPSRTP